MHPESITTYITDYDNLNCVTYDTLSVVEKMKFFEQKYAIEDTLLEYVTPIAEKMRVPFLDEHFPAGDYTLKKVLICGATGKSLLCEQISNLLPFSHKYPHVINSRSDGERIVSIYGKIVIDWVVSDGYDVYDYAGADYAIVLVDLYTQGSNGVNTIWYDIQRMCEGVKILVVGNVYSGKEKVNTTDFTSSHWDYVELDVSTDTDKILQVAGVV